MVLNKRGIQSLRIMLSREIIISERREKMRKQIIVLAILAIFALGTAAFAGIDEPTNSLLNGSFGNGAAEWETIGSVGFNAGSDPVAGKASVAMSTGESGSIRQIVDASAFPGWNAEYDHGTAELSFWAFTTGSGYIKVGFDWWDNDNQAKPRGIPADHLVVLDTQYTATSDWTQFVVPFDWKYQVGPNHQPRWISIEFFFYGCANGNSAYIDDTLLQTQCVPVPEPSSLMAMVCGVAGLGGFACRRRRS